jgi:hypothetical protein
MVNCPACGKPITDPGYVFGTESKMRCFSCLCGGNVVVNADPPEVLEKKLNELKRTARDK